MSVTGDRQTGAALVADLSLSFQDELTATIQNAFGVALEIAVLEVTKLVGQALRDVRDQMHETLRENESLKQRLQSAEVELGAVRKANAVGRAPPPGPQDEPQPGKQPAAPVSAPVDPSDILLEEKFDFLSVEADPDRDRSFCEIREDGQVCSHDLTPNTGGQTASRCQPGGAAVSKSSQTRMYSDTQVETVRFDQPCPETVPGVSNTGAFLKAASPPDSSLPNPKLEQPIKVKEESPEGGCAPPELGCVSVPAAFAGVEDDFCPDSLSLAQSRLLEDWRPEPLHLQNCDTDTLAACTSHSLSDSPVFGTDLSDLDLHAPSSSGLPAFSKAYQHPGPVPRPHYSSRVSGPDVTQPSVTPPAGGTHSCRVCGESFHLQEELRRHRSQHHSQNQVHGSKSSRHPRRQAFPPGRSPYHCSLCGRDFNRMEHLKIHQRIHTGERPYACTVCNARFRHSWALTRHFRIHTGEKPYACSLCGKTFRNCGGLRFHQRSHSLEGNG
uniref:Si:ch211-284e13.5 n=1 Tax=Paramormyrops kingsleyae TaxID=1676925 RepID=A0A3B3RLB8_9TELE|nr:zinc finger protein 324B-like [Paramormyrops kingsleyae]